MVFFGKRKNAFHIGVFFAAKDIKLVSDTGPPLPHLAKPRGRNENDISSKPTENI